MLYIVSYDLNAQTSEYARLHELLGAYPANRRILQSTWLIRTDDAVRQVYENLVPAIRKPDRLLVVDVSRSAYYGWMPADVWPWIRDHWGDNS